MLKTVVLLNLALSLLAFKPTFAQSQPAPAAVAQAVVDAANRLLQTLDESQRQTLLFPFDDQEQRRRWSNLPAGIYPRGGLRLGDLNEGQQEALWGLLKATLSQRGYQQILDNVLGDEELNSPLSWGRATFGKDEFYLSILGTPSITTPWIWQFGGHHLGLNATVVGDQITLAPSLTGGEPISYQLAGRHVEQLAGEREKAHALLSSLSPEQLKKAVLSPRPIDWAFGPQTRDITPKPQGIGAVALNADQQVLLLALIEERVGILNPVHTGIAMTKIRAQLSSTYFAWFGPVKKGQAASFRIQGPAVIIEYAPQRVRGGKTDHLHAIYRDPSNEYGAGFIQDPF